MDHLKANRVILWSFANSSVSLTCFYELFVSCLRIDSKTFSLKEKLNKMSSLQQPLDKDHEKLSQETVVVTKEVRLILRDS